MGVYWIHPDARPSVCPSVCRQGFRNFLKKTIGSIDSIPSIYPYGVNLLNPIHFCVSRLILALWWPNIWPKIGFPELFEITIGPIHFIPGIYPYGVSLLTPIHFRVPSLILSPLVAKYLAENKVSGIKKKYKPLLDISGWGEYWSERGYIVPIYGHSLFLMLMGGVKFTSTDMLNELVITSYVKMSIRR